MEYCAIITVDEDFFWDVSFVSSNKEKITKVFNDKVDEILKDGVGVENEGSNYVVFDDGREVWVVCGNGESDVKNGFIVFGEMEYGFVLEGVFQNKREALDKVEEIKSEYAKDGISVYKEYDDVLVFENDDVFKIKEIKIN